MSKGFGCPLSKETSAYSTMKYRKLRIAWSVGWGVMCLLLIALWVRSYWWTDNIVGQLSPKVYIGVGLFPGAMGLGYSPDSNVTPWTLQTYSAVSSMGTYTESRVWGVFMFKVEAFVVPIWLLLMMSALFSTFPWLRWRFSLRALLIATTLVAVVLGLIIYAAR